MYLHYLKTPVHTGDVYKRQPKLLQVPEKCDAPLIRRCAMLHQCIINVKDYSAVALLIKPVKIDLVSGYDIFIRIKTLKHVISPLRLNINTPYMAQGV